MNNGPDRMKRWPFVGGALLFVSLLLLLPSVTRAERPVLPPRTTPTVTPTPVLPTATSIPTPTPSGIPALEDEEGEGSGTIRLVVQGDAAASIDWPSLWTEVSWVDGEGIWHAVEGWQSGLDSVSGGMGMKSWSVPASLFGQGPFRWEIYDRRGGELLAASRNFNLPGREGLTVTVEVTLEDDAAAPEPLLPASGGDAAGGALLLLGVVLCFVIGAVGGAILDFRF